MPTALVTGAGGFLGTHVCHALLAAGHDPVALTRPGGRPAPASVRGVEVAGGRDVANLADLIDRVRPAVIHHLAGTPRMDDLTALYEINVLYAAALLEASRASDTRPAVVLIGSAAEYGPPRRGDGVVREDDACRPTTAYGIAKLAQTHHGLAAAASGVPVVVARLFNPIGAGSPATSALGAFVRQVAALPPSGGTLTTGPLHAVRDFTGARETAAAIVALGQHPEAHGRVFNVCSGVGRSLSDVVARLVALAPVPVRPVVDASRGGTSDLDVVVGDPSRLRGLRIDIPEPDIDALLREMLAEVSPGVR
jgi:GDP-4-dehydro-6-deoxy-D-mannose reductase